MADVYKRGIYLYINGEQVNNDIKSIKNEMLKLINAQARMTRGSQEYVEAGRKIAAMRGILNEHQRSLRETAGLWGSLKKAATGFNRNIGMVASFIAGLAGVGLGLKSAIEAANTFEERLGNLSALTGLNGRELAWLGDTAKETSIKITEGGVRIKQSASDIVDAYTKMGSQRPELLKNKEALAAVSEDAIILAEASKSELEPAVAALATTMNQFNTSALESRRIINILAAGSKEGAAEIPYLTDALEKTGTSANMMGLSIEQTVGMIEAVAPKFAEAKVAGTGFDRVLMLMRKNNIGFKDGLFDMNRALDELRVRYKNGQSSVDLFGMEHAKMADVMLQAQGDYNKYTAAVTGSSVAIEQASKNTKNNNAILQQERNKLQLVAMEFGEKLAPAQVLGTKTLTGFITVLMKAPKWIKDNQTILIALAGAVLAYNGAVIRSIALSVKASALRLKDQLVFKVQLAQETIRLAMTAAQATQTAALTVVQKMAVLTQLALNAAMKANPLGLLIAGITGLVLAVKYFSKNSKENLDLETSKKALTEDLTLANKNLKSSYDELGSKIGTLNQLSVQEKKDLDEKITKTVALAEAELTVLKGRKDLVEKSSSKLTIVQNVVSMFQASPEKDKQKKETNAKKAVEPLNDLIQAQEEVITKLRNQQTEIQDVTKAEIQADAIGTGSFSELDVKLQKYGVALKNVIKDSEDYLRIQKKIKQVQDLIDESPGSGFGNDGKAGENKKLEEKKKLEEEITKTIEEAYQQRVLLLKQNYTNEKITQGLYEAAMFAEEVRYLENLIAARRKHGLSTVAEEQKLQDKLIEVNQSSREKYKKIEEEFYEWSDQLLAEQFADMDTKSDEEIEAQKVLSDRLLDIKAKQIKEEADLDEKAKQERLAKIEAIGQIATSSIDTVLKFQQAAMNRELAAAGENTKKREEIERKYNEKKRKWAIGQAIIEGVLEVARIWSNIGSTGVGIPIAIVQTGVAVARTAAEVAVLSSQQFEKGNYPAGLGDSVITPLSPAPLLPGMPVIQTPQTVYFRLLKLLGYNPTPPDAATPATPQQPPPIHRQFATGKYPVMGADDKRIYQATLLGKVKTGLYKTPTLGLFSEKEPEIVIDGPTTRRIRANFPQILNAIQSVRVNQHASGLYPGVDGLKGTQSTSLYQLSAKGNDTPVNNRNASDSKSDITALLQSNLQMMRQVILSHEKPGTVSFNSIQNAQSEYDFIKSKTTIS